jgi:uncharacterized protein YodC (DUF2158 family)
MADHDFIPGDLVQLKSGGPDMTYIADAISPDMGRCEWFKDGKRETRDFVYTSLKKSPPKSGQTPMTRG